MKSILLEICLVNLVLRSSLGQPSNSAKSAFISTSSPLTTCNTATEAKPSSCTHKFVKARIVNGASPSMGRNGLPLFAKKKKDVNAGKSGKIQVKLLKHIAGTGSAGDIISVAPAFFANKLQKSGSAVKITNEEVEKDNAVKAEQEEEAKDLANVLKEKFENITLELPKKAGPDGKLFGGISYKTVIDELKTKFPKGALDAKYIKITDMKDEDGASLNHDIKSVGDYTATISLLKGISTDFKVSIKASSD